MTEPISSFPTMPSWPVRTTNSTRAAAPSGKSATDFQDLLVRTLEETSSLEQQAQISVLESLTGGEVTQVEALAAMKKADLALRLMLQIRNKLLEAYQQIQQMRM
ncbi:MAG TPA: flagellar hook-basal body complex protein FliE [Planctomycetaceae bacterium]|nr:flagellar hook-basal body complex protein FliE [Planctomycetaceae bacterium]